MDTIDKSIIDDLCKNIIGSKVVAVHIIKYVLPDGDIDNTDIELEILCDNNCIMRFATAPDGERVIVHREQWIDPFKEPISEDNLQYIKIHGKWSCFDASEHTEFAPIIGKTITEIDIIKNKFGVAAGVAVCCEENTFCFCTHCDEGKLFWGKDNTDMTDLGFTTKTKGDEF